MIRMLNFKKFNFYCLINNFILFIDKYRCTIFKISANEKGVLIKNAIVNSLISFIFQLYRGSNLTYTL